MDIEDRLVPLQDGRDLGVRIAGPPDGRALVVLGGAPGSTRLDVDPHAEAAAARGLRAIGIDRPGIGMSGRHPEGTLRDWARDLGHAMDVLGHSRFAVMALSGGAPFALAAGQYLPDRVVHLTLVAPGWFPHHRSTRGVGTMFRLFWWLARHSRTLFTGLLSGMASAMTDPDRSIADSMPEVDQRVLAAHPELEVSMKASFREAMRNGLEGVVDDARLVARPVGVDPRSVHVPVDVWHGEGDRNVAVAVGRSLVAQLPNAVGHFFADEGHVSIGVNHHDTILDAIPEW